MGPGGLSAGTPSAHCLYRSFDNHSFQRYFSKDPLHSTRIQPFEISFYWGDQEAPHVDRSRADHNPGVPILEKDVRAVFPPWENHKAPFPFLVKSSDIHHGLFVKEENFS